MSVWREREKKEEKRLNKTRGLVRVSGVLLCTGLLLMFIVCIIVVLIAYKLKS